ncbi:hypothetical protein GL218_05540 [Daldinia childiae]|uniref:uncharacterized protein n=1 Tax=Daldinia childiae TaxID=326645 RepID=UPI001446D79D|nr:uncharacterized protein GL218_05540 [Daldinia childiae]KAF3058078.1 hypothetical protein GL218_05540 [Daldinia childiae]
MSESMWTEDEIRYFRALLAWVASDEDDDCGYDKLPPLERHAGEFMFLVLGDKGCGKTSLLERFCSGTFAEEDRPSELDEQERGYRHILRIEDQTYVINALELPSRHLSSEDQLTQAVQITEAVVLVYDVKSRASFTLIQDVYNPYSRYDRADAHVWPHARRYQFRLRGRTASGILGRGPQARSKLRAWMRIPRDLGQIR